nr:dCTP deaminase [Plesiocystis pacifica]
MTADVPVVEHRPAPRLALRPLPPAPRPLPRRPRRGQHRAARRAHRDPRAGGLRAATWAFALGTTLERVRVPADLVARVEGRSSIGRLAVVVHATAGFIDPGFEGQITLELSNLGRCAVKLYPGMRISQIVFHEMKSPAERPYGAARGSKYQGQEGPVASRIGKDR